MKLFLAVFVFFLTLSLTYKVSAAEVETCQASATEKCAPNKSEGHENKHAVQHSENSEHGEHNELSKKMNSLFPEKQKDLTFSDRPTIVKLASPKFLEVISGSTVKLNWNQVDRATNYHVQVATDPNFKWLVANDHWVKGTTFEVSKLEAGKRYFWRVASVKDDNISMHTKSLFVSSAFDTK